MKNRLDKNKNALKIALIVYVGITTVIFLLLSGWIYSHNSLVTYVATAIYIIPVMALIVVFACDKRFPILVRIVISLILLIPWTMYVVFGFIIELSKLSMIGKM